VPDSPDHKSQRPDGPPIYETTVRGNLKLIKVPNCNLMQNEQGFYINSRGNTGIYVKQDRINSLYKIFQENSKLPNQVDEEQTNNITGRVDGYRKILNYTKFQKVYGLVENYNFPGQSEYGEPAPIRQHVFPCHNCGIYVPVGMIQIDHRHPQNAGEPDESAGALRAFVKALRWSGLTIAKPDGSKANFENDADQKSIHPLGNQPGIFIKRSRYKRENRNTSPFSDPNKWLLSDEGKIVFSAWIAQNMLSEYVLVNGNSISIRTWGQFRGKNLNIYLNLVPLCPICNNKKDNNLKGIR
jgi:hypothetical protein